MNTYMRQHYGCIMIILVLTLILILILIFIIITCEDPPPTRSSCPAAGPRAPRTTAAR
jgi:high-affinity Fe2+/Pb2+ permease